MIAINRISLSWRFVIIDLLLFTVFYFINNHLNIAGDLLMYIFTMALRIFFLMLVLETGHVFAVSLKQWIPVFVSYCILFFAG